MALPFAGDGDVEAVRVLDRLRGCREGQALGDGSVADVGLVERVEYETERVAVCEDCKGAPAVLARGLGGVLRRTGGFLLPPGLVHPPEFGPALRPAAAGRMVAAGIHGAVCKLDGKRPVLVRP